MELIDIYKSIKNPLDDPKIIDTIIEKYSDSSSLNFYTALTKATKKENVGKYYPKDKDKFYAKLFNVWKENVCTMSRERFELLKKHGIYDDKFIKLRKYLLTVPNVKTADEARKIIFGSHADKDLEDAFEKYAWNSEGQYSSWEYVSSQKISAFRSNGMDSEHRLYINTDPLDIYKVSMYLISKCVQRNIPYDFKFDEAGNRDDTIIIYTDTDHFLDFISILNEIEKEHPEIIANVKNPPLLSGKIGGWIGYGTEPKIPGKKTSFNEVRADAIEEAMNKSVTDWLEEHFIRLIAYNNNTVHVFEYVSAVVTDEILKQLTSSFNWRIENEEKLALQKHTKPNYQKVYADMGIAGDDLKNIRFKNYIYQHVLSVLKNDLINILRKDTSDVEIIIPLKNDKKYELTTAKIKSSVKLVTPRIVKKDASFKDRVKENIKTKLDEVGVDPNNIAFDKQMVDKLRTTPMPELHKPVVKIPTVKEETEDKPQKAVPIEPQKVVQAKTSSFVHTTYVPSHKLIDNLNELLDYNPDRVIEFLYNNMAAIRLLLPIVVRKNKEIATQFYDANINNYPELESIYNKSITPTIGGY